MVANLLWLLLIATNPPAITVKPSGDGYRAEAETFELDSAQTVHDQIEKQATKLCAGKEVRWGKFGSLAELGKAPGATSPKISGFFQEFRCSAPDKRTFAAAPADWKPSPSDEADARRTFESYYRKRDAGEFAAARAMFSTDARPQEQSDEYLLNYNRKLGAGSRRITGLTWYVNPTSAPHPGVYVALDFIGDHPGVHVYCGYVVLHRLDTGSYEIVREEQNTFDRGDGTEDPSHIAAIRASACRGG